MNPFFTEENVTALATKVFEDLDKVAIQVNVMQSHKKKHGYVSFICPSEGEAYNMLAITNRISAFTDKIRVRLNHKTAKFHLKIRPVDTNLTSNTVLFTLSFYEAV